MRRRIRARILSWLRPRNFTELMDTALSLFPDCGTVDEDSERQLVLYTGLQEGPNGEIRPIEL